MNVRKLYTLMMNYCFNVLTFFQGIKSVSNYPISFHQITADEMYNYEYYTYHLRPYGIIAGLEEVNKQYVVRK